MGKSIMILGAGQGVGLETARRFGNAGYTVGLVRRGQSSLEERQIESWAKNIDNQSCSWWNRFLGQSLETDG